MLIYQKPIEIINEKEDINREDPFYQTLNRIMLYSMDIHWQEHLQSMDYARSSTSLRAMVKENHS